MFTSSGSSQRDLDDVKMVDKRSKTRKRNCLISIKFYYYTVTIFEFKNFHNLEVCFIYINIEITLVN